MDESVAPVLNMENIKFRWPKATRDFLAIASFTLQAGERVLLQGSSGSGKSTLLNLVAGTLSPCSGHIAVCGAPLSKATQIQRDKLRANHMGIIFQQFNLLPYVSVLENVLLPLHVSKKRAATLDTPKVEAMRLLERLGLPDIDPKRAVSKLSIGQQQRVAAARALIGAPSLIIADEPTSALDDAARDSFMQLLLAEAKRANSAIVFVSHDTRLEGYFDRIVPISGFHA